MDNDLKLSQFLDAWGHDDVALAQEVLTAHSWDVESALLAVSEGGDSNAPLAANPGVYDPAAAQQQEVDADGYRAPMRTGYTDRLIGPDPMDFGGMSLDEQAAMVAAMTGGQAAAAAAAQEEDAALRAMQASSCEFERLADQHEQGFLAEAMQQSYAMAMAQERQRMESFHEAERAEQQQMAKAIEESFREQSRAEAKFREELDKAIADSTGQVPQQQHAPAPSAVGHSSSSAGHSRHASRPGSACSSGSNHRQPLPQQTVGRMGSAASYGTSPSSSTGFAQHSSAGAAAAAAYPPRLPGSSAGSGSSSQPGRLSSEVVGRACGQSSRPVDPSQRRPSKNALPPTSGYGQRAAPPPPPSHSQGRATNAETANAERVVSSTRLTKQSAGPSVNGTASAINRPGVRTGPSRMNHVPMNSRHAESGSASQELPGEERGLRSQGSGSFQRSTPGGGGAAAAAAAAAAAPSRPIKLDARIEYAGSRGELPASANNPIVRAGATMSAGSPKHHAPPPLHPTSSSKASHRPAAFPQPGGSSSTSAASQSSSSMAYQQQQQHHPHQHHDRRREQQVLSTKQQMDAEQQHLAEIRRREMAEAQQREVQRQEAEEIRRREAAAAAEEEARRRAAEELRRREAEELRRREAEELRQREADELRKREAEELRKREAEELRRREAEEQRAREAEQRGAAELARRRQQMVAEQRSQASVQSAQKDSATASQQGQLRERDPAGQVGTGSRHGEENGRPLRSGAEKRSASQARAAAAAEARAAQAAAQAAATAATPAENPLSQQQVEEQRRKEAHEAELARREAEEAAMRAQQADDKDKDKAKDEVVASLGSLWKTHREHNPQALAAGLTALRTYIGNLAKNPQDPKFHRINVDNQAFKTRVASLEGAIAVLHACGFAEDETGALVVGEAFLKSKGSKLFSALDKLNVMLDQLGKQG